MSRVTSTAIVYERLRMFGATDSGISAVPPSQFEYRFHSLNGVLNAHAQPVG